MSLGPFAGITGSLKALRDIFPSGTDTKINRLDETISSRLSAELGAKQIELNAVKAKTDFIPSALTAGTLDTSRNTALLADIAAVQTKVNFIPSALTSGTTDTSRDSAIQTDLTSIETKVNNVKTKTDYIPSTLAQDLTDIETKINTIDTVVDLNYTNIGSVATALATMPTYSSVVKKVYFREMSRSGYGSSFSSTFTAVNAAKTIIIPCSFTGAVGTTQAPTNVAAYEFKLHSDATKVQWDVRVNYTSGSYDAKVYVVEFF